MNSAMNKIEQLYWIQNLERYVVNLAVIFAMVVDESCELRVDYCLRTLFHPFFLFHFQIRKLEIRWYRNGTFFFIPSPKNAPP